MNGAQLHAMLSMTESIDQALNLPSLVSGAYDGGTKAASDRATLCIHKSGGQVSGLIPIQ
jgi:hypothetical protein